MTYQCRETLIRERGVGSLFGKTVGALRTGVSSASLLKVVTSFLVVALGLVTRRRGFFVGLVSEASSTALTTAGKRRRGVLGLVVSLVSFSITDMHCSICYYEYNLYMFADFTIIFNVYSLVLLIIVTTVFLVATFKKDNSIMDIVYGPSFLIATTVTMLLLNISHALAYLILGLVTLWSLRLGFRIYRKNRKAPEDARYARWRTEWQKQGQLYFLLRSYLQVNILQGLVILAVSLPIILVLSYSGAGEENTIFTVATVIGTLVFFIGLTLESVADYQLDRFMARKKAGVETATLMKSGLFRYSRRPNYFGESLIWLGIAIIALPLPLGYLALLSPLTITYVVTRVTGPLLEKIFLERYPSEYAAYMRETSYFIPLPRRE